jgi:hypothetical protein
MLPRVPQSSGHTMHAPHIEPPARPFSVAFHAPAYVNVLWFTAGTRWVRVLAETPEGALRIARSHHFRGSDFRLIDPPSPEAAASPAAPSRTLPSASPADDGRADSPTGSRGPGGLPMRQRLQHHLNALHVMALLIACGCPRLLARRLADRWEQLAHPWLYGPTGARSIAPPGRL